MKKLLLLFLPTLLFLAACDSPEKTLESLQSEIGNFAANPTPNTEQKIEAGFQKLASEISSLRAKGKTSEADSLQQQANSLRSQYETARLAGSINKARQAIQGVGEQIGELFKPTPTPPAP